MFTCGMRAINAVLCEKSTMLKNYHTGMNPYSSTPPAAERSIMAMGGSFFFFIYTKESRSSPIKSPMAM